MERLQRVRQHRLKVHYGALCVNGEDKADLQRQKSLPQLDGLWSDGSGGEYEEGWSSVR